MAKKLFIGNLPFSSTEEGLRNLFSQYGDVHSITIVTDKYTGAQRGFGFVEMDNADEAMSSLNGTEYESRTLRIDEAKAREPRSSGGGRHDNRGGGSSRGYSGGRGFNRNSW